MDLDPWGGVQGRGCRRVSACKGCTRARGGHARMQHACNTHAMSPWRGAQRLVHGVWAAHTCEHACAHACACGTRRRRATCTGATAATSPTCASPTTTSTSSRSGARTPASSNGGCWGGQRHPAAAPPAPLSPAGTPTRAEPPLCFLFLGCFLLPFLTLLGTKEGGGLVSPPPVFTLHCERPQ